MLEILALLSLTHLIRRFHAFSWRPQDYYAWVSAVESRNDLSLPYSLTQLGKAHSVSSLTQIVKISCILFNMSIISRRDGAAWQRGRCFEVSKEDVRPQLAFGLRLNP